MLNGGVYVNDEGADVSTWCICVLQTHMQCQRCPVNGRKLELSAMQTARKLVTEEGSFRLFRGGCCCQGEQLNECTTALT